MTANIYLSKAGVGVVTISTFRIEESLSNKTTAITTPTASGNYPLGPKDTKILDLLIVERRLIIMGEVADNVDTTGITPAETSSSASGSSGKKATLLKLFMSGGQMNLVYANTIKSYIDSSTTITGVIEKLSIVEESRDETTPTTYTVNMTFLIGVNLQGGS